MAGWTNDELKAIDSAEELEIKTQRKDGTFRDPVTIWVNRISDKVIIRAYKGRKGFWFRGAVDQHRGHIRCGGVEKDVAIVEVTSPDIIKQVDHAYLTKYGDYNKEVVDPMLTDQARAATLQLIPV